MGGKSHHGFCKALNISGTNIDSGIALEVNAAMTSSISVTSFSDTSGAVCYSDEGTNNHGMCNALTLAGMTLSKGAHILLNENATSFISVDGFSHNSGVVCYLNEGVVEGVCRALTLSGMNLLTGNEFLVNGAETESTSVAGLSGTTGVACYSDASNGEIGACHALHIEETTSTSTSTTTTTTTSTMTSTASRSTTLTRTATETSTNTSTSTPTTTTFSKSSTSTTFTRSSSVTVTSASSHTVTTTMVTTETGTTTETTYFLATSATMGPTGIPEDVQNTEPVSAAVSVNSMLSSTLRVLAILVAILEL